MLNKAQLKNNAEYANKICQIWQFRMPSLAKNVKFGKICNFGIFAKCWYLKLPNLAKFAKFGIFCQIWQFRMLLYTRISGRASHLWYGSLPAPYLITVYVKLRESKIETNAFNVIKVICIFCIKYICKVVGSQISIWNLDLVLTRSGDDELRSGRLFRNCMTD